MNGQPNNFTGEWPFLSWHESGTANRGLPEAAAPLELPRKKSNHIYFTATLDAAKWGAELATSGPQERIYVVEPTGEFENDPNVTDKRFPGNPTRSYRSKSPLKIIAELGKWERHSDDEINQMLTALNTLREQGKAVIYD